MYCVHNIIIYAKDSSFVSAFRRPISRRSEVQRGCRLQLTGDAALSAVRCCAMLCYAVLWCVMLCYAVLCCAMRWHALVCPTMLCYALLCSATPCYSLLRSATLCYALLRSAMLCYALLCQTCRRGNGGKRGRLRGGLAGARAKLLQVVRVWVVPWGPLAPKSKRTTKVTKYFLANV